jgi:hypothetical protein
LGVLAQLHDEWLARDPVLDERASAPCLVKLLVYRVLPYANRHHLISVEHRPDYGGFVGCCLVGISPLRQMASIPQPNELCSLRDQVWVRLFLHNQIKGSPSSRHSTRHDIRDDDADRRNNYGPGLYPEAIGRSVQL